MRILTTVALGGDAHVQGLGIHINNACPATIARNLFLLKTICSTEFDPNNSADLNYIWDVMNNATWPESTHNRFKQDVKGLQDSPLPQNIIIPGSFHKELKEIYSGWLTMMETFLWITSLLIGRHQPIIYDWISTIYEIFMVGQHFFLNAGS